MTPYVAVLIVAIVAVVAPYILTVKFVEAFTSHEF